MRIWQDVKYLGLSTQIILVWFIVLVHCNITFETDWNDLDAVEDKIWTRTNIWLSLQDLSVVFTKKLVMYTG